MAACLYLNGYPGIGKLTIAKEISKLIPNARVFDNHLIIDPAAALFDRGAPEYQPLRRELRQACLKAISTSTTTKDVTWIFTDSQSSDAVGSASVQDYYQAVVARGSPFFSIILECDLNENLRRIEMPERLAATTTKLLDVSILQYIRDNEDIYHSNDGNELTLDVTHLSPVEAAKHIVEHVNTRLGRA